MKHAADDKIIDFWMRQSDTQTPIEAVLSDRLGVIDLTGSTISFHMTARTYEDPAVILDQPATIVNPPGADGLVRYDWQPGDADEEGDFYAEFEVTFPSGDIATFPNNGYLVVRITREIA